MKIQSVKIQNFRTLKNVEIYFDSVTTFIGPNGTGKSTVLRALDWFFNGRSGSLTEKDCSFGATNEAIEVRVTFDSLTDRDRVALGKYAPEGVTTFTAWKRRSPDGGDILSANAKGLPDFNAIKAAGSVAEKKGLYSDLQQRRPELNLPLAKTGQAIEQAMTTWEAANINQLFDAPEALETNFFGFNSGGKMSGLFDFVLVTADLRASEESVDGKASIIGRILERSIDRTAADKAIAEIVAESRAKQQQVYNETFEEQLVSIRTKLNQVVTTYAPGRSITISPADVELKAPRTTFDVSVLDGTTRTAVERQGHGFQRTLLISALQLLAQSGAASSEGVICLAIEEPELFQHPIQAQAFAKVLRSLAEDSSKRIQVTYATHSPYFLEARYFHQVRRLTRSSEEIPTITVHSSSLESVQKRLKEIVDPKVIENQLDGNVSGDLAIALFANRAFLVEGTTESAVFYGIGDKMSSGALEAAGISIIPVGGKTSIPLAHAILESIGVPVYTLFDADGGYKARAEAKGKEQAKIIEEGRKNAGENRKLMKYFGLIEEDFPKAIVSEKVAIFEDNLESFMANSWRGWEIACRTLEEDTGISLLKNKLAYRSTILRMKEEPPAMLKDILKKAQGFS